MPGNVGPQGPAGPSIAYGASSSGVNVGSNPNYITVISKSVPVSTYYVVNVKMWAENLDPDNNAFLSCELREEGTVVDTTQVSDFDFVSQSSVTLGGLVLVFGGIGNGTIDTICQEFGPSNDLIIRDVQLSAIKISNVG